MPFRDTAVEGFESARRRARVRLAARALAAGAVAHRGRGAEARRGRAAARDDRQLGLRPRLPGPRGPAPGVPHHARRRSSTTTPARWTRRNLGAYVRGGISRRDAARVEEHLEECRALHGDLPRAHRGQLQPRRPAGPAPARRRGRGVRRRRRLAAWPALRRSRAGSCSCWTGPATLVAAHAPASAVAGVAATVVVGGAVFMTVHDPAPTRPATRRAAGGRPADTADAKLPAPGAGRGGGQRAAAPGRRAAPSRTATSRRRSPYPTSSPTPTASPRRPAEPEPTDPPTRPTSPDSEPPPPGAERADGRRPTCGSPAFATAQAPGAFKVVVAVSGATSGSTTLTVAGEGLSIALTGDGRCARSGRSGRARAR